MRKIGFTCLLAILMAAGIATTERAHAAPAKFDTKQAPQIDAKPTTPPTANKLTEAQMKYIAGRAEFESGRWRFALEKFYQAQAASGQNGSAPLTAKQIADLQYNVGVCHLHIALEETTVIKRYNGLELALSAFQEAKATLVNGGADLARANTDFLHDIETKIEEVGKQQSELAQQQIQRSPPEPTRRVLGATLLLPATEESQKTSNPGPSTNNPSNSLQAGRAKQYAPSIGMGVGGGAIMITGLALWAHALKAVADLREQDKACGGMCNLQPRADALQTQFAVGLTLNIVGLVAGGVATALGVLKYKAGQSKEHTSFIPTSGGGSLSWNF